MSTCMNSATSHWLHRAGMGVERATSFRVREAKMWYIWESKKVKRARVDLLIPTRSCTRGSSTGEFRELSHTHTHTQCTVAAV